ncbi:hypothetical protein Ciccas_000133 [Cichlidogyrus casuarinus]|uniref:Protein kinase domain-containing protein n=1 Tax=Cichlidogyrus casuarinus TaxID=1844966 RepID=A0ABD2QR60_9PLAT
MLNRTPHTRLYRVKERDTGRLRLLKMLKTDETIEDEFDLQQRRASWLPHLRPRSIRDYRIENSSGLVSPLLGRRSRPSSAISASADRRIKAAERELRLLASIEHENMIKLHEVYEEARRLLWVTDDIPGQTLWHEINHKVNLSERKAAQVSRQLLGLLEQLHRKGVVHLGIQPENIFYDELANRVTVAGGSQSQWMSDERPVRLTFRSMIYLPDELRYSSEYGGSQRVGVFTDMWSMGCLLYQMVTGDLRGSPDLTTLRNKRVSSSLVDLATGLLEPDPKKRLTATQALQHSWFKSTLDDPQRPPSVASTRRITLEEDEPQHHDVRTSIEDRAYLRLMKSLEITSEETHASQRKRRAEEEVERLIAEEEDYMTRLVKRKQRIMAQRMEEDFEVDEESTFIMHVKLEPKGPIPKIIAPLNAVQTEEGREAVLRCSVHLPKPSLRLRPSTEEISDLQVFWEINGRPLWVDGERIKSRIDSISGEITLRISQVGVHDVGTYSVRIVGRYGEVGDSTNLRVQGSAKAPVQLTLPQSDRQADIGARILLPLVDTTILVGTRLKLKARVTGIPKPRCTWMFNGTALKDKPHCRLWMEELTPFSSRTTSVPELLLTLTIDQVSSLDAGLYSLTVTNKNGTDTCSAIVDIIGTLHSII